MDFKKHDIFQSDENSYACTVCNSSMAMKKRTECQINEKHFSCKYCGVKIEILLQLK